MTKKSNGGRPTSLTPQVEKKILAAIEKGNYITIACKYAGISNETFYNWKKRAEKKEEPFFGFFNKVEVAEAKAEISAIEKLRAIMNSGDVKSASAIQSFLKMRYKERWSDRLELAGDQDKPINVKVTYED